MMQALSTCFATDFAGNAVSAVSTCCWSRDTSLSARNAHSPLGGRADSAWGFGQSGGQNTGRLQLSKPNGTDAWIRMDRCGLQRRLAPEISRLDNDDPWPIQEAMETSSSLSRTDTGWLRQRSRQLASRSTFAGSPNP